MSFLKKFHISVNIRPSYIGQYIIFNIDRYMLTYSDKNIGVDKLGPDSPELELDLLFGAQNS